METYKSFDLDLSSVNERNFGDIALQLFHFQAQNNPVYKEYLQCLRLRPQLVKDVPDIPFLPISFFKNHIVKTGAWVPQLHFASSGTTGQKTTVYPLRSLEFYQAHAVRCFEFFFSKIQNYHFLALLPSYLERQDSSLVAMMDFFIKKSGSPHSGFYLHNTSQLLADLENLRNSGKKTILWGVTFALLDLAERYHPDLRHCMIFETGGMKGRRQEITRPELHRILSEAFQVTEIYSEYGMTELLSQAYSRGKNAFFCPPWMKILARDITDPFEKGLLNESGGINVIDFANLDTIAFIETEDLGKVYGDGSFEVLGRLDNSDMRGCNLMVEQT
ncbi:MAG TPA: acyl transferase [Chryseosolibacter sp.]|nr:acyl transferase [Chryseosolibacter sp.]